LPDQPPPTSELDQLRQDFAAHRLAAQGLYARFKAVVGGRAVPELTLPAASNEGGRLYKAVVLVLLSLTTLRSWAEPAAEFFARAPEVLSLPAPKAQEAQQAPEPRSPRPAPAEPPSEWGHETPAPSLPPAVKPASTAKGPLYLILVYRDGQSDPAALAAASLRADPALAGSLAALDVRFYAWEWSDPRLDQTNARSHFPDPPDLPAILLYDEKARFLDLDGRPRPGGSDPVTRLPATPAELLARVKAFRGP
jgi:hypothetical protein